MTEEQFQELLNAVSDAKDDIEYVRSGIEDDIKKIHDKIANLEKTVIALALLNEPDDETAQKTLWRLMNLKEKC